MTTAIILVLLVNLSALMGIAWRLETLLLMVDGEIKRCQPEDAREQAPEPQRQPRLVQENMV